MQLHTLASIALPLASFGVSVAAVPAGSSANIAFDVRVPSLLWILIHLVLLRPWRSGVTRNLTGLKEQDRIAAIRGFARYKSEGTESASSQFDLIKYWDASSVPCERVFSSSKETYTLRRSRLLPELLEILQLLKYMYQELRLDFMADFVAKEEDYVIEGNITE
ncbi:hypothetical protein FB451DRAFT_1184885 [Mycena latifolia]|nr:hypothetical protein FB451DRAFT_1184885 [Mycena latifolia]